MSRRRAISIARRGATPVGLILLWQLGASSGWLSSRTLAAPSKIATTFWDLLADGQIQSSLAVSVRRAALGLLLGGSIGLVLGTLSGVFRLGEDVFDGTVQMVRTLPFLGVLPLFIYWFGIGEQMKVFLVALGVFFPLYLNTFAGIRSVDDKLVEVGRAYRLSRLQLLREVILPGALPSVLVGLRYSLGLVWLALVVGEQVNARSGIGHLLTDAREFNRTDIVVVALGIYAALGLFADVVVRTLEGVLLTWRRSFAGT